MRLYFQGTKPIFVTDTVADVLVMRQVLPLDQIYAVDWGFNSYEDSIQVFTY